MKNRNSAQREKLVTSVMLVLMVLAFNACGSKSENSSNQTGTLKKSLNVADEAAAIRTLQNIFRAETEYMIGHDGSFGTFDQLVKSSSLDQRFAGSAPVVEGYVFTLNLKTDASGKAADYSINADPKEVSASAGARHLYMDAGSNVVRGNASRTAGPNDPPVSQ